MKNKRLVLIFCVSFLEGTSCYNLGRRLNIEAAALGAGSASVPNLQGPRGPSQAVPKAVATKKSEWEEGPTTKSEREEKAEENELEPAITPDGESPKDDRGRRGTNICLTSVAYIGDDKFAWGDRQEQSGLCSGVQEHLGLCEASPPRECLLARVPWQTHYSLVECCFRCCVDFWQKSLGLVDIYNYWYTSEQFKGHMIGGDQQPPGLDKMYLNHNSLKRFSLFMWDLTERWPPGGGEHNATHLVAHLGGGGTIGFQRMFAIQDSPARRYLDTHPVSVNLYHDTETILTPGSTDVKVNTVNGVFDFSHGGHFFTANGNDNSSAAVISIPWGAQSITFDKLLAAREPIMNRTILMSCCCMFNRRGRSDRISALTANGACTDDGASRVSQEEYVSRFHRSKFVLSPIGGGYSCFRDAEAVLAGAVPVLDGYLSGGKSLYDENFPAVHVPLCGSLATGVNTPKENPVYCEPELVTAAFLEAEYAKLEMRRDELDTAKVYWPYWLYHAFKQVQVPRA